ncbi:Eco57I restriction-modification methylase domain-containing protein [Corynebacterium sp. HMSC05D03]|uniref:Eco57I restriction-modification methylase domain-containing protein n=1 Tax=Corynebacterium sp. HMSC05D03 TaxID=1581115 RepID=UPI0008A20CDD|nr:DNA methyltransferase [Corynebacterium sp. HMSC05D03]OFT64657.1 hypothetical protein HMPREF3147_09790 [Corynebacterium sp. HMSC05D03]
MSGFASVEELCRTYAVGRQTYESPTGYTEAETRSEFIDVLWMNLGWDVRNRHGVAPYKRDVVLEKNQRQLGSSGQKPDYTIRINGESRYNIEAKKPSVPVFSDKSAIFQARRYGYTDQHAIVVLTNFRDLIVFDATVPVDEGRDHAETALLARWNYKEYVDSWDEISDLLGKKAVGTVNWAFSTAASKQDLPADKAFINHFNSWRMEIGQSILENSPSISEIHLNDAVQQLLNRLIFIRMCEDRGIEGEETLRKVVTGDITNLPALFETLHTRYNTGLFATVSPKFDPVILTDSSVIIDIVNRLYAPRSPFSFAVLDADFLGLVYEASLAQHLIIKDGAISLAQKSEYKNRDVVTTPQALVDRTVAEAVALVPEKIERPTVLDFSVGSGRFLLSTFNELVARETERNIKAGNYSGLIKIGQDEWRLSFKAKRDLLTQCCFGIDIDYNAVEVARFSLIVHLLDDEIKATLPTGSNILPDLTQNIVCGNTLVRPSPDAPSSTSALDLESTTLPPRFDMVVGNPPYMSTESMRKYDLFEFKYLQANYTTPYKQFDKYFAFVEFAITCATAQGVIGVVIPNKWMTVASGSLLRKFVLENATPVWLHNFRHHSIFDGKMIYVCAIVLSKSKSTNVRYSEPRSVEEFSLGTYEVFSTPRNEISSHPEGEWILPASEREAVILKGLTQNSIRLGDIVEPKNGLQTSRNKVFIIDNFTEQKGLVTFWKKDPDTGNSKKWTIEKGITKPYLKDSKRVQSHHSVMADSLILYPYTGGGLQKVEPVSMEQMKEEFPRALEYLTAYKDSLESRDKQAKLMMQKTGLFYVFGRWQAFEYCLEKPKIFYSVNQRGNKYGIDLTGIAYQSGGTAGEVALYPKSADFSLEFVLALLDQEEIEFFLTKRGSPFRGGFYSRGTDVITDVPVPDLDFSNPDHVDFHDSVRELMIKLRKLSDNDHSVAPRDKVRHITSKKELRAEIRQKFLDWWHF